MLPPQESKEIEPKTAEIEQNQPNVGSDIDPQGNLVIPRSVAEALKSVIDRNPWIMQELHTRLMASEHQNRIKLAGDVVPLQINPSSTAGPTPNSANYALGKDKDPQVLPIGNDTLRAWMDRMRAKQSKK